MFFKRKAKIEGIHKSINELNLFPDFFSEETQNKFKEATEITDNLAYILSKYGWYISSDMSWKLVLDIFLAVKRDDVKFINNKIKRYYSKNLTIKQDKLIKRFPDRKGIIIEAFEAHRKKMYFSSTALFLTQTDGLCQGRLFRNKKAREILTNEKERRSIFNAVLLNESAINVDTRKEDKSEYKSDLNRHAIMHGFDTKYSNEINSLKALSILCFVSDFID